MEQFFFELKKKTAIARLKHGSINHVTVRRKQYMTRREEENRLCRSSPIHSKKEVNVGGSAINLRLLLVATRDG